MASEETTTNKFTNPIRLSHKNLSFSPSEKKAADEINVYHKFILYNVGKDEKCMILDTFISTCSPFFLIPIMYKMETENKASFLTLCRSNIIQKLITQKLKIKLKSGKLINYDIVLCFAFYRDVGIDVQTILNNVVRLRFTKEATVKKDLNLENFVNDKQLKLIYCPLHIPVVFDTILHIARSLTRSNYSMDGKPPVRDVNLRSNNLESLEFTDKVFSFHLAKLDVRDNKLSDLSLLRSFSEYKITELWLDGNPFCNKYDSVKDYIIAVKSLFPNLQVLDGKIIGEKIKPSYHKHFINDKTKIHLIKQFVEHFFTCYDQEDRIILNGLYDAGALFSMTLGSNFDNLHKQVIKSFASNRNLLKFVDYAKCTEFLLHGPERIISALRREPPTLHKLKHLDIDLIYTINNCFVISVQGPFIYRKNNIPPLWFQRTLIVVAKEDNEFCIVNDQYHLDGLPNLNDTYLSELKMVSEKSIPVFTPISFSLAEKYQLLRLLQELTTMNTEFSDKFLRDANWDIRQAIRTFINSYGNNKIPSEAFLF